jgi:hypothetical protein
MALNLHIPPGSKREALYFRGEVGLFALDAVELLAARLDNFVPLLELRATLARRWPRADVDAALLHLEAEGEIELRIEAAGSRTDHQACIAVEGRGPLAFASLRRRTQT